MSHLPKKCIDLRVGCLILAYLNLVMAASGVSGNLMYLLGEESPPQAAGGWAFVVGSLVQALVCALLVWGLHARRPRLVFPFLVNAVILLICTAVNFFLIIIDRSVFEYAQYAFWIGLQVFSTVVVFLYYRQMTAPPAPEPQHA